MKNVSRRHHYISQFYLKGFARHGSKKPQIIVINKHEKRCFKTTSNNLASIYDFNRIESEGIKSDAFENELSKFETKAANAIRSLHESMKFDGENRKLILQLIAMFATRNPSVRNNIADFHSKVYKTSLLMLLRNKPEMKEGLISIIKKLKPEKGDNISNEEVKKFVDEEIVFSLNTAYHLHTESIMIESILNLLALRKWTILQSPGETSPFITSDMPAVLCWENPEEIPAMYRYHPGFGMAKTIVYFPLSQKLALIGKFDGEDVIAPPSETLAAIANTMQLIHSKNQLYMPHTDFGYLTGNEGIQKGRRLLE